MRAAIRYDIGSMEDVEVVLESDGSFTALHRAEKPATSLQTVRKWG
jgi:hypothetical protein